MKPVTISTNVTPLEGERILSVKSDVRLRIAIVTEVLSYLLASAIALGIDFVSYIGLIRLLGMNYQLAAAVGFSLGLVTIYFLSVKFVFQARAVNNSLAEFLLFTGIGIAGLLLNSLILYMAVDKLHQAYELSKLISAGFVFCFNFSLRKLMLFNKKKEK